MFMNTFFRNFASTTAGDADRAHHADGQLPNLAQSNSTFFDELSTTIQARFEEELQSMLRKLPPTLHQIELSSETPSYTLGRFTQQISYMEGFRIVGAFSNLSVMHAKINIFGHCLDLHFSGGVAWSDLHRFDNTSASTPQNTANNVSGCVEGKSDWKMILFVEMFRSDVSEFLRPAVFDRGVDVKWKTVESEGVGTTIIPKVGSKLLNSVSVENFQIMVDDHFDGEASSDSISETDHTADNDSMEELQSLSPKSSDGKSEDTGNRGNTGGKLRSCRLILLQFSTSTTSYKSDVIPLSYFVGPSSAPRPYSVACLVDEGGRCLSDFESFKPFFSIRPSKSTRVLIIKCLEYTPPWFSSSSSGNASETSASAYGNSSDENENVDDPSRQSLEDLFTDALLGDGLPKDFKEMIDPFTFDLCFFHRPPPPPTAASSASSATAPVDSTGAVPLQDVD